MAAWYNCSKSTIFGTFGPHVWRWVWLDSPKSISAFILCHGHYVKFQKDQSNRTKVIVKKNMVSTDKKQQHTRTIIRKQNILKNNEIYS